MIENIFGTIAMLTAIIGLLPQIVKSYKTKSTDDISMIMLWNYLIGSVAWVVHGICINSAYVVWSNVLGGIVSAISIYQKFLYDTRYRKI
ncbi:MAG: hypothetical protein E7015_03400 [Alphaproteobacteria bacterium]|nr:hypothetical protein [Alphaproteobacteria bacterium]